MNQFKNLMYLCGLLLLSSIEFSHAQNTFPNEGNIGIGTMTPKDKLHLKDGSFLLEWGEKPADESLFILMRTNIPGDSYGYKFSWRNADLSSRLSALVFDKGGSVFAPHKLGVGGYSADRELHVHGVIKAENIGDGATLLELASERGWAFKQRGTGSRTALELSNNGSNKNFLISTDGKVGIGNAAPDQKLHVNGAIKAENIGDGATLLELASERGWAFKQRGTGSRTALELSNNGSNKNFLISTDGRVGIGNAAPDQKLHVNGAIKVENTGDGAVLLELASERGWAFKQKGTGSNTALELSNNGSNKNFLINTTGGVAISNHTVPQGYKLAVNGKVICEELKVQLSENWPDYVFENDYPLVPLSEVKTFIQTNKHLPGMPSAEEIALEEGIEIGEMQRKMLEKIEELTLHMIQLDEKNAKLEKQNEKLAQQNNEMYQIIQSIKK